MDGTDVGAALEEMGGEAVSEGVASDTLGERGLGGGVLEAPLQGIFEEVVSGIFSGARVGTEFGGGENELPGPFAWGVGVFAGEGFGHVNLTDTGEKVEAVFFAVGFEVSLESGFEDFWKGDEAVFPSFGVMDGDGAVPEVDVLDAEAKAFHDAEAGPVEELGGEFPGVVEEAEHGADFVAGQHGRRAAGAASGGVDVKGEFGVPEDVAEEEDEGIEGLFLSGGSDLAFEGEVLEVGGDSGRSGVNG